VGLRYAHGDYIHFVDADDYLFPGFYKRLDQVLGEKTVDYIRFRNQAFDMKSHEDIKRAYYSLDDLPKELWGKCIRFETAPDVFLNIARAPWAGIVNKDFILNNKILFNDLICCNDRSFYVQVLYYAQSVLFCNLFGVYHQINNKDSLVGIRKFNFECHFRSYSLIEEILKEAEQHIKQKIMGGELKDLLYWYKTLDGNEACRWKKRLDSFLRKVDITKLDFNVTSDPLIMEMLDEFGLNPLDKLETIYSEEDLYNVLSNNGLIYLYGAGKVADAFFNNIPKEYLQNITQVLVTWLKRETERFHGLPVCLPDDMKGRGNECVVVATSRQYQLSIYCNLYLKGYRNIVLFSEKFCKDLLENYKLGSKKEGN